MDTFVIQDVEVDDSNATVEGAIKLSYTWVACNEAGGNNPFKLGSVTAIYEYGKSRAPITRTITQGDKCLTSEEGYDHPLREMYCAGKEWKSQLYDCEFGCEEGACFEEPIEELCDGIDNDGDSWIDKKIAMIDGEPVLNEEDYLNYINQGIELVVTASCIDDENCGGFEDACGLNSYCLVSISSTKGANCACNDGWKNCQDDDGSTDCDNFVATDPNHCGACGVVCESEVCEFGFCVEEKFVCQDSNSLLLGESGSYFFIDTIYNVTFYDASYQAYAGGLHQADFQVHDVNLSVSEGESEALSSEILLHLTVLLELPEGLQANFCFASSE